MDVFANLCNERTAVGIKIVSFFALFLIFNFFFCVELTELMFVSPTEQGVY